MLIREEATIETPLNTELPQHVQNAANQTPETPYVPNAPLPVGDAAILMAADGYGNGMVKGIRRDEIITIKTSETIKNFSTDGEPPVAEVFRIAYAAFKQIERDRHMEH